MSTDADMGSLRITTPGLPRNEGRGLQPLVSTGIDSLLEGHWVETRDGRCFVAKRSLPPSYQHGHDSLAALFTVPSESLSQLCREPALAGVDLGSVAFLDIETTGLERDMGTLVFLVGVLYYRDGEFHIWQYFMDRTANERALLSTLTEFVAEFSALVTFNGRSFDVPMLEMRLGLHSLPRPLSAMPHADLLYPARRLWKQRLGTCRLTALERGILGIARPGDVPGARIPEIYYRYLSEKDPRPLLPVFEHNTNDLLTLLAITAEAGRRHADPFAGRVTSGLDFLSLGRVYEWAGDDDMALRAYDRALALALHPADRDEVCRRITPLYKRRALMDHAVKLWEQMVTSSDTRGVYPYKELAKYYEHDLQRYDRAEELLMTALDLLPRDCCTRTTRQELEKRLLRVRAKLRASSTGTEG
ncbi:MAG: ribonuclease H-like domain-containing protein [Chloroflexota bacterium]|nr:ribonuclease H-like domain-containing protein [Chloroflexota bacterium]